MPMDSDYIDPNIKNNVNLNNAVFENIDNVQSVDLMSGGPSVVGGGSPSGVLEPGVPGPSGHCQSMFNVGVPAYEPIMEPYLFQNV